MHHSGIQTHATDSGRGTHEDRGKDENIRRECDCGQDEQQGLPDPRNQAQDSNDEEGNDGNRSPRSDTRSSPRPGP